MNIETRVTSISEDWVELSFDSLVDIPGLAEGLSVEFKVTALTGDEQMPDWRIGDTVPIEVRGGHKTPRPMKARRDMEHG